MILRSLPLSSGAYYASPTRVGDVATTRQWPWSQTTKTPAYGLLHHSHGKA